MSSRKSHPLNKSQARGQLLLLASVLAALFWHSFLPGYVQFSNDGPLGQQNTAWSALPSGFTGSWGDLNSIGTSAGAVPFGLSALIRWVSGPVGFAKFYAPIALFILGLGAWTFLRQLKLSPLASVLGGLAAALNSSFLSRACWGIAAHPIAVGMDFFALSLIVSNTPQTPVLTRWVRLALAGLAVGAGVMEGADVGAILSLFIAAFVFYKTLNEQGVPILKRIGDGIMRVAVVAMFAGFLALQTIVGLVGSSVTGIVGTAQDSETKAKQWDFATQWSLPKKETLGFFVPGLFGYRMDTPKDMSPSLQDAYKGGEYWGGEGRTPALDRYFDSGSQGSEPSGPGIIMRFNGDGHYLGILVALLAAFAIAQSFRRENSPFTVMQKKFVWFWAGAMGISLLLAWGRFAPFYQFFYALPYVSTIRNPVKFIFVFSWAVVILSAFGTHVLSRRYLEVPADKIKSFPAQLINWWAKVRGFDRKWTIACAIAVIGSALAWLIYSTQKPALIHYLQIVGFPDEGSAKEIAAFSIGQAGWFILIFALTAGLFTLILAGIFSGKRAKLGGILLGALLVLDLGRADLPFIIHQDYVQKYDIDPATPRNSVNPIINILRDKPYEHRVADLPFRWPDQLQKFEELYGIEWMQHHFPYYNIQSLDVVQMPRGAADVAAFESALAPQNTQDTAYLILRRWQLTNTRYLLGPAAYLDVMNEQLDPAQKRFRILNRFSLVPKQGVAIPTGISPEQFVNYLPADQITAQISDDGPYALFEFTGALPRAKLYSNWQTSTNDAATLETLADKNFDPQQTILVATPLPGASSTNQNSGTVEFKSYAPKDIVFSTESDTTSVLLLNDKFDPHWSVTVDGQPAQLQRCNFIMRGVYLPPGAHTVEFNFSLPHGPLYVTLAAIATGVLLLGILFFLQRRNPAAKTN